MVLYMITNDYENQYKLLSLSNVLQYHDVNMVLCNDILNVDCEMELQNMDYIVDTDDDLDLYNYYDDIYQYYIIDDYSSDLFIKLEYPVFYSNVLNVYVVGITHYGTSWNYILTNQTFDDYGVTSE